MGRWDRRSELGSENGVIPDNGQVVICGYPRNMRLAWERSWNVPYTSRSDVRDQRSMGSMAIWQVWQVCPLIGSGRV